jgi:O-antigen ligase
MTEILRRLINVLVFLSPALTLIVWGSYTVVNLCLILVGVYVLVRRKTFVIDEQAIRGSILLCGVLLIYAILGIGLSAYHGEPLKFYGQYLIFLLMPLAYWAIAGVGIDQKYLWLGAATGGILSGTYSGYQVFALGVGRAGGYIDNIQYGNIGVVLATGSMVGIFQWLKSGRGKSPAMLLLILGVSGGICTSLFSGSKGGWLSFVIVIVFLERLIRPYWSSGRRRLVIIAALSVCALMISLPQSPVNKRLVHAWQDYQLWSNSGSTAGGSVGPRLELWRFGLSVAFEKPLLGFGYRGLMARKSEAVAAGQFDQGIDTQPGLHNHFLHSYISYGLFGLLQVAILLLIPLQFFTKKWRQEMPDSIALAVMGVLLILTHIEFGMSNGLFELNAVRQVFLFWLVVLMGALHYLDRDSSNEIQKK